MSQNYAFLQYQPSATVTVAGNSVTTTLANSTTGIPGSACRIWNAGTAGATVFVLLGTVTAVSVTNGMPFPGASIDVPVVRTGGQSKIQLTSASTTTVNIGTGEGID